MKELLSLNSEHIELINKTFRILGKKSKCDSLKIYEDEKYFIVITKNTSDKYVTRTKIGKIKWQVIDCFYQKPGEEEQRIK